MSNLTIRFKVDGDDKLFEDPIELVRHAAFLSQSRGGEKLKLMRGVKYKHRKDFKWTSMGGFELPLPATDMGPIAYDDNGVSATSVFQRKETF